ncbi:MAG: S1/P1 nuclease [Steroidobacterales bacterium]
MKRVRLALWLLCLWLPAGAHAWGDEGHEIVALIAAHYLEPQVRARITALLDTDASGLTADRGIAAESTWADLYRTHAPDTATWHYVDRETDGTMLPAHGEILARVAQFRAELADPATSAGERLLALQFLLHLVGDLHQPLHAADDHDRGGNTRQVVAAGERQGNLHHYWDIVFVARLGEDPRVVADALIAGITPRELEQAMRGTPQDWAAESFLVAKTEVYGRLPASAANGVRELDERYVREAMQTVRRQLQFAGVRLARVLNEALR